LIRPFVTEDPVVVVDVVAPPLLVGECEIADRDQPWCTIAAGVSPRRPSGIEHGPHTWRRDRGADVALTPPCHPRKRRVRHSAEQQRNRLGLPGHRGVIPTPDSTTLPNMLVNSEIALDATAEFTRRQGVDDEVVVSVAADPNPERQTPARDAGDAYSLASSTGGHTVVIMTVLVSPILVVTAAA